MNLLELLGDAWAIKPNHLELLQQLYVERKERRLSASELKDVELAIGKPLNNNAEKPYQVIEGVAIIPVMGSIAKRGSFFSNVSGLTSYEAIQQNLREAERDPQVLAALLNMDTPGGTANGTATAAAEIRRFAQVKPIGAWTDGMMTSAGMWLGAATGDVRIANDTTELGSIGVISRHVDVSKMQELEGVKTTVLTAGRYKGVGHPYAALSAEHQGVMQERLDYLYSAFVNAIAEYRGRSPEEVLQTMADGRIFTGRQAIEIGLADGMMSFDDMVNHMRQKAQKKHTTLSVTGGKASAEIPQEEKNMKLEELKEQYPALYSEVFESGATAERTRIQGVLTLPGAAAMAHKDLVHGLAFDGKTTAPEAAHQVLLAEDRMRVQAADDMQAEAARPAPVASAEGGGEVEAKQTAEAQSLSAKMIAQANEGK